MFFQTAFKEIDVQPQINLNTLATVKSIKLIWQDLIKKNCSIDRKKGQLDAQMSQQKMNPRPLVLDFSCVNNAITHCLERS